MARDTGGRRSHRHAQPVAPPAPDRPTLVARQAQEAALAAFLDAVLAGDAAAPHVVFTTGEAGAGKSSLLDAFATSAQEANADLVAARGGCNAQTGLSDPYLPFREVLASLAGSDNDASAARSQPKRSSRLRGARALGTKVLLEVGPDLVSLLATGLPGVGLVLQSGTVVARRAGWVDGPKKHKRQAVVPFEGVGDQSRIFEQYTAMLAALSQTTPVLIILDDLHWADVASIDLLFHLARRLGSARVLVVGAYRADEVAVGRGDERHPLAKVVAELTRDHGDIRIDLDQATRTDGRAFVDALVDTEPNHLDEHFRAALYARTEGHALFTIELLRHLQDRKDLVQDVEGRWVEAATLDWERLPARVEGVIEERVGRLDRDLRELLQAASVEGADFIAQVLVSVLDLPERHVLRALAQELAGRHRLVREADETTVGVHALSRYQFSHGLFQQYLYRGLGAGERRVLHGEVAIALESLYDGRTDEIPLVLARHWREAGQNEKAVGYLLGAGDRARALYAHTEAVEAYTDALGILEKLGDQERAARTLMKLGLTHHVAFNFTAARQAYDEGFVRWQAASRQRPRDLPVAPHALRLAWAEPETLDPALPTDVWSVAVACQLFSGLVELSSDMEIVPDLARSWAVSDNGRKVIFALRDDARWTDGTPVTASDFEYAWRRLLDPATHSPVASLLFDIEGARSFNEGRLSDPDALGVHAVDARTLVVDLAEPTPYFLQLLTLSVTFPVPRRVVERHGPAWAQPGAIVTNGPFMLDSWAPGQRLTLVRNPGWSGRAHGNVERVELSVLGHATATPDAYERGELDVLSLLPFPGPERDRLRRRHADDYLTTPLLMTCFATFERSRPPLDDGRVRQALALATDRGRLADVVMGGYASQADGGLLPLGMPGHSPGIGLPYDPERARRLLADAGYPGGQGFPDLRGVRVGSVAMAGDYIRDEWRANLGIESRWADVRAGSGAIRDTPGDVFLIAWLADYPDPANLLNLYLAYYADTDTDHTFRRIVEDARAAGSHDMRMGLYAKADRFLVDGALCLPLVYDRQHLLMKPWVRRFPTSPTASWFWNEVILEPHG